MDKKNYKIRSFNKNTAQIEISVEDYHSLILIDLPLDENNNVPTGEYLENYINGFIPYGWFERTTKLKNPINNAQTIEDMVEPLPPIELQGLDELLDFTDAEISGVDALPKIESKI